MTQDRSKQAGMLTSAELIRFGFKSIIGIVLARILIPAELGTYRQLFLIYATFSTLMLLGIPQSALFFLPKLRHIDSKKEFISRTVNLVTLLAFLFGIAIFAFRGFIARIFNNPRLDLLLIIYAVYPLFMFVTQIYSSITLGMKRPSKTIAFTLFSVASDAVFILGTALLTRNLYYIVLGVMVSAFIQWGFAHFNLNSYRTKVSFDPEFYREVFQYSLPLGLASIIGMLSIQLDKFVVSGFFTPAQYAVFSIGAVELPFISILANSVNAILLPSISGDPGRLTDIYRAAVRKNALIIFPLAMLFFIFAHPIITLLYTDTYAASVPYFQVYLLILPLRIATYGIIFMALKKTRYIMLNSIFVLLLNLVLNLILVKSMGMMGAAVATVIATWISVGIYLYWIKRKLLFRLPELFPFKALLRTLVAVLLAGLLAASILWIFGRAGGTQILSAAVFAVAYLALARFLNAILPYDVQYALKLIDQARTRIKRVF
ncbi:MAG: oligosaccharide flippase family protein [Candidatus Syntrophosphaera sp.]